MSATTSRSIVAWLFAAVAATAATAVMDLAFLDGYTDHLGMKSWPSAPGVIVSSDTISQRGPKGIHVWGPRLGYSFTAQGTARAGDKYQLHDEPSGSKARAERIKAAFPPGRGVEVWYEPGGCQRSVLDRSFTEADIVLWNITFPAHALALALWGALGSRTWWRLSGHPAGGVRLVVSPGTVRAVLCKRAPLSEALGTAAGTGFALAGAVYIAWIFFDVGRLPIGLVPGIAVTGAVAGVLMFIWRTALIRAGRFDMIIDEPTGLLALPRTMGRADDVALPLESVTGVSVSEVVRQEGRHKTRVYQPLLQFSDDLGKPASAALVEWRDKARAERFAQWLRAWLEEAKRLRGRRRR